MNATVTIARRCGTIAALAVLVSALAVPAWATSSASNRSRPIPRAQQTPEIDPGVARGIATILVGGVLILRDRRRRR